jgi:hypothetical protein
MDERCTNAVQYGHMGRGTYLPEVQSWHFSRSNERREFALINNRESSLTFHSGSRVLHWSDQNNCAAVPKTYASGVREAQELEQLSAENAS